MIAKDRDTARRLFLLSLLSPFSLISPHLTSLPTVFTVATTASFKILTHLPLNARAFHTTVVRYLPTVHFNPRVFLPQYLADILPLPLPSPF